MCFICWIKAEMSNLQWRQWHRVSRVLGHPQLCPALHHTPLPPLWGVGSLAQCSLPICNTHLRHHNILQQNINTIFFFKDSNYPYNFLLFKNCLWHAILLKLAAPVYASLSQSHHWQLSLHFPSSIQDCDDWCCSYLLSSCLESCFLMKSDCWSTRRTLSTRNSTLCWGFRSNMAPITMAATSVFPVPATHQSHTHYLQWDMTFRTI